MKTAGVPKGHCTFITTAKSVSAVARQKSGLPLQTRLRVEQVFELAVLPLSIRLEQVESVHRRNEKKAEELGSRLEWLHQDLRESCLWECEKSGPFKKMKELSLIHSLVTSTYDRKGDKGKDDLCKSVKAHVLADNLLHFAESELQEKGEIEQKLANYFNRETRAVILKRKKLMEDVRSQVIDQREQIDLVRGSHKTHRAAKPRKKKAESPKKSACAFDNILHLLEKTASDEVEEILNEKENVEETDTPKKSAAARTELQRKSHARCLEPVSPENDRLDSLSPERKLTEEELVQFLIRNYSKPLQEKKLSNQPAAQETDKQQEAPSHFRMSSEERRSLVKRMLGGERLHHQTTPEKLQSCSDKSLSPKEVKRNFAFGKLSSTERKDPPPLKRSLSPEERRELINSYLRKEAFLNHMKVPEQPRSARRSWEEWPATSRRASSARESPAAWRYVRRSG